jgi:ParB/RepB/Spo0J family partition protein
MTSRERKSSGRLAIEENLSLLKPGAASEIRQATQLLNIERKAPMEPISIALDQIHDNPYQPRMVDDAEHIEKLARSIAADGLLQKPNARTNGQGFQLAFGHSRRKAFEWLSSNYQAQGLQDRYSGYTFMPLDIVELTDEEMYRHAISENVQRKDLNPIELAKAMIAYRDQFNKSSEEVGQLFGGMSGATVRGLVRLLDLPAAVQDKVASGEITQGTARTMLSMQKIAPEKVIVATLKKIEKTQDEVHPDETIENIVSHNLPDAVRMWNERQQDGKPRSSRNGWLLDMKNFPNKLLPELTPVDIAIALGIQDDQEMISHASTWYAMKTGELNLELEGAEKEEGWDLTPEMMGLTPELIQKLEHLINPPACSTCPFYTKIWGSHFCGLKVCHTRKNAAWADDKIRQASKNLKIEIYQKSDGAHRALDYDNMKLFKSRHKGLRLLPKDQFKGYAYQHSYEGVDTDFFVVVATGDAIEKMNRSSGRQQGGKKTTAELIKMRQLKIYRPRRRELIWEFTLAARSLFDAVPYPILRKIDRWDYLQQELQPSKNVMLADNAPVDEAKADYLRRLLIWKMAVSDAWNEVNNVTSFDSIVKRLEKLAQEWGVKMPKTIVEMGERFQLELDDVSAATRAQKADENRKKK